MQQRDFKEEIDNILVRQKRYREPNYSAAKLADELGINAWQLARIIKKTYGKAYSDIILPLRINEAMTYLLDESKSEYSIEEIGLLVGFRNKWSFFQAFRKYVGSTPGKWRRSPTPPLFLNGLGHRLVALEERTVCDDYPSREGGSRMNKKNKIE